LGSAWGQSTISLTNSAAATGNNSFVNLSLGKFNSNLGVLTGVSVQVNFVTVGGSYTFQTTTGDELEVGEVNARVTVRQATNTTGFSQLGQTTVPVSVTPSLPFTIPGNSSQTFTLSPTNVFTNQVQTISSDFWSAYQSSGGSGSVVFQVRNNPDQADVSGGTRLFDVNNFTATANMSVTYTYTAGPEPIPEPSTVAAGAFLTLMAAATYWRRRRSAR
jgi:hypothetical protein